MEQPVYIEEVKKILAEALHLGSAGAALSAESPLLGALPELDSMGVVTVIAALEERFDIVVDDDEISATTFETVGSLAAFVADKAAQ
jgi:acyl carrier protein